MSPACFSPSTKQSTVAKAGKTSSAYLVHHARCFVQVCVATQLLQHEVCHSGTRDCRDNGVSPNVFPAPIRPSTSPVRQSRGTDDCPSQWTLLDESFFCFVIDNHVPQSKRRNNVFAQQTQLMATVPNTKKRQVDESL